MLSTIKFYGQLGFTTIKIQHKHLKGMLAAKAEPAKLFTSQTVP